MHSDGINVNPCRLQLFVSGVDTAGTEMTVLTVWIPVAAQPPNQSFGRHDLKCTMKTMGDLNHTYEQCCALKRAIGLIVQAQGSFELKLNE